MSTCEVKGCNSKIYYRRLGMCRMHYNRYQNGSDMFAKSQQGKSLEERFKEKLASPNPVTGCMNWTGAMHRCGYGLFMYNNKTALAHRIAWELEHGPIPDGLHVCHECDNPPCCNLLHLFLGTRADNMEDMSRKGRSTKGERQINAKLTENSVAEIRRRLATGEPQRSIAMAFGVSQKAISKIKIGSIWKKRLQYTDEKSFPSLPPTRS